MRIVTPVGEFYSGEIDYMSFEAHDGRVGLMSGALSRICVLRAGVINIKTSVIDINVLCDGGLVVVDGGVTVLSENCRFETDEAPPEESTGKKSSRDMKFVKAKIASNLKNMNDRSDKHR